MGSLPAEFEAPPKELIFDDGEPLETWWHKVQGDLFIEIMAQAMAERGQDDYFIGGNMFIYYSRTQAEAVLTQSIAETRHFRGPDVFLVNRVEDIGERKAWIVWEESGRYPNLILELLSPTTARVDRTTKREIYEQTFRTPEYLLYDRESDELTVLRLERGAYVPVAPDHRGWTWSEQLALWIGRWEGTYRRVETRWLRLFDEKGRLIPTERELGEAAAQKADAAAQKAEAAVQRAGSAEQRAEAAEQKAEAAARQAEAERRRAEAAEAELARLRAQTPKPE